MSCGVFEFRSEVPRLQVIVRRRPPGGFVCFYVVG